MTAVLSVTELGLNDFLAQDAPIVEKQTALKLYFLAAVIDIMLSSGI
jgi:hypothetical protein